MQLIHFAKDCTGNAMQIGAGDFVFNGSEVRFEYPLLQREVSQALYRQRQQQKYPDTGCG